MFCILVVCVLNVIQAITVIRILLVWCFALNILCADDLKPEHVAVIYNENVPHSKELAELYVKERGVPTRNLIALRCSDKESISRKEFEETIWWALKQQARKNQWWTISGSTIVSRKIYAFLLISGMPMKINEDASLFLMDEKPSGTTTTKASVDSELMMLMCDDFERKGMLGNPYYGKDESFVGSQYPICLVSRIDAPSLTACKRMIKDPVSVEKKGLWGWMVVDEGGPYPEGDTWLKKVAESGRKHGFPVYWDQKRSLIPAHMPLPDRVAYYAGWYTGALCGPFDSPTFRFEPGAVAMHIHSFSASTIRDPKKGWSGPLLEKGAAVTVGNVNEPFLGPSHHFDVFYERLSQGYTVAEAGTMSVPSMSWQAVLLGDPLYRPFKAKKTKAIVKNESDKIFQALWLAGIEFGYGTSHWYQKLSDAAKSSTDSTISEALGHDCLQKSQWAEAKGFFDQGHRKATATRDKIRMGWFFGEALEKSDGAKVYGHFIENLNKQFPSGDGVLLIQKKLEELKPKK